MDYDIFSHTLIERVSYVFEIIFCIFSNVFYTQLFIPSYLYAGSVTYKVHSPQNGWLPSVSSGQIAGNIGQGRNYIGGVKISTNSLPRSCKLQYRVSAANIGWMPWKFDSETAGTTKSNNWIEAIKIMLINCSGWNIKAKAYNKKLGWRDWRYSGEVVGTIGQSLPLEALKIVLERK